jgi:hypothetical protein
MHTYIFCSNFSKSKFWLAMILVGQKLVANQSDLLCDQATAAEIKYNTWLIANERSDERNRNLTLVPAKAGHRSLHIGEPIR